MSTVLLLLSLVVFIPMITVFVRRLHDVGRSGWWWLIAFVPFGGLVLLVFLLLDSTPGPNHWGPPPVGSSYADPRSWRIFYAAQAPAGPPAGWGSPGAQVPGWGTPPQASWASPAYGQPPVPPPAWQTPATPQGAWPTQPRPARLAVAFDRWVGRATAQLA